MNGVKHHLAAKQELSQRKTANERKQLARQREIAQKYPQYESLKNEMASCGAKIVQAVLNGGNIESVQAQTAAASAKIKELLIKANLPHDYLEPIYSCEICRDSGTTETGCCKCYTDIVRRLTAEEINTRSPLAITTFDSFELEFYPDTKSESSAATMREIMRRNLMFCKDYAENFHLPGTGLLFSGRTGLGKTHLSLAIAGKVIDNGFHVIYGSAPDLFRKIENEHFGREQGDTMTTLQSAQLLVLDDIGAEWDSGFYVSVFYNLLNSRLNSRLPLIISTNLNLMELEKRYDERIVSRLLTMRLLEFFGNDIRLKRRFLA
jgi:DNA replication protein DnaC